MSLGLIIFLVTITLWLAFGIWLQIYDAHPRAREQAREMLAEGKVTDIERYLRIIKIFAGSKDPEERDLLHKLHQLD